MNNHDLRQQLAEAKRRLPLPALMAHLGHGNHAKRSAPCPFHGDAHNSFSVFHGKSGGWFFKCHAGCGQGDGVDYLKIALNVTTKDAIRRYCQLAGIH